MHAMKARRPARGSHAPGSSWYCNNRDFNVAGTACKPGTGLTVFKALGREPAGPLQLQDFRLAEHARYLYEPLSEHPAYSMRITPLLSALLAAAAAA